MRYFEKVTTKACPFLKRRSIYATPIKLLRTKLASLETEIVQNLWVSIPTLHNQISSLLMLEF